MTKVSKAHQLDEHLEITHSPVIFFDGAPIYGHYNGIYAITLAVNLARPGSKGTILNEPNVIAYPRTNEEGLKSLREAIDNALLAAAPADGSTN